VEDPPVDEEDEIRAKKCGFPSYGSLGWEAEVLGRQEKASTGDFEGIANA